MIAKHVSMRSARRSSFAELVRYMTQGQPRVERVGDVVVTNCAVGGEVDAAVAEVGHTQARNTRSAVDKTYHLLISFPSGEEPSKAALIKIEARFCQALGYGEHQRVSAVHTDTDCLHIHVAINKVHPVRLTVLTPKGDFHTLAQTCVALEFEFGLQVTNHQPQKTRSVNAGDDMERIGRLESLQGWLRRECAPALVAAPDWATFNRVLSEHGVSAHLRGNGMVFVDEAGLAVKASTVGRQFSKLALEKRLGAFAPVSVAGQPVTPVTRPAPARRYEARPVRSSNRTANKTAVNTNALFAQYKQEREARWSVRAERMASSRVNFGRDIEEAKSRARAERAMVRLSRTGAPQRKLLYGSIQRALGAEMERARARQRAERETINDFTRAPGWSDWLKLQATQGNGDALEALRIGGSRGRGGASIAGSGDDYAQGRSVDHVTRNGTRVARVGHALLRDDGERLRLSESITDPALADTLREAVDQFGTHLSVHGSEVFQERVAQIAVRMPIEITFDATWLEGRRQVLAAIHTQGVGHGSQGTGSSAGSGADAGGERNAEDSRRSSRASSGTNRATNSGVISEGDEGPEGLGERRKASDGRGRDEASGPVREPGRFEIGGEPPPEARNRLRTLSELPVVRLRGGAEVLLPPHVPGDLEHGDVGVTDSGLRRPDAGDDSQQRVGASDGQRTGTGSTRTSIKSPDLNTSSSPTAGDGWAQADKYIAQRAATRARGIGVAEHRRFDALDTARGERFQFAGLRKVDGRDLILLRKGHQVLVKPATSGEAEKLVRVRIDSVISIREGVLQIGRGRSL